MRTWTKLLLLHLRYFPLLFSSTVFIPYPSLSLPLLSPPHSSCLSFTRFIFYISLTRLCCICTPADLPNVPPPPPPSPLLLPHRPSIVAHLHSVSFGHRSFSRSNMRRRATDRSVASVAPRTTRSQLVSRWTGEYLHHNKYIYIHTYIVKIIFLFWCKIHYYNF